MNLRNGIYVLTWAWLILIGWIVVTPEGVSPIAFDFNFGPVIGGVSIALGAYHLVQELRGRRATAA